MSSRGLLLPIRLAERMLEIRRVWVGKGSEAGVINRRREKWCIGEYMVDLQEKAFCCPLKVM